MQLADLLANINNQPMTIFHFLSAEYFNNFHFTPDEGAELGKLVNNKTIC